MQSSIDLDQAAKGGATQAPSAPPLAETTPNATATSPSVQGQWSEVFSLPNVPIHMHVLRNGRVLFWGRRKQPTDDSFESLNEHETHPFLFDPTTKCCTPTSNQ